jgi:hypothetical protein
VSVNVEDGTAERLVAESKLRDAHRTARCTATIAAALLAVPCRPRPTKVILNDPATVVLWADGTKTVSKARGGDDGDLFFPSVGVAACVFKKVMGREARLDDFERLVRDAAWHYVNNGPTKLRSDAMAIRLAYATRGGDMTIHELAPTWVRVFDTGRWDDDTWLSVADFLLTYCAALKLTCGYEALEREREGMR